MIIVFIGALIAIGIYILSAIKAVTNMREYQESEMDGKKI